jgi:hypothetical protein
MNRNMVRAICAAAIAAGGAFHVAGLYMVEKVGFQGPWWMYLIFGIAIIGYPASAVGILFDKKPGVIFALLGPVIGGVFIFIGLMSPDLDYEILIPGTFANEITPLGFLTLVIEPMASLSAFLLLTWRSPRS